ncbi:hypothetical protein BVX94_01860 [bacterium B17]|nr:hypothetical protein BVX94_01860 [bacterium B17]
MTKNVNIGNSRELQKKSSAVSLSDMEMFIFPDLLYGLVLANIMSPRIWLWLDDPWFAGLERMKPYRRITRLRQFIMDHYMFNLDLDTWGLTTKESELERFKDFIDEDTLAKSNALFGYEGDKYYFDIDIRTHFGLDKYEGNVIPYWKTETVEAMDAFCHKPDYHIGAGECVSLAALYAAALFIVAKIPLKDIYLMATPLHSQNYIDIDDGVLTNNRRLVTKNMWCNGTALSAQARRALENERVTIVAHETGCIHTIYNEATINPEACKHFFGKLRSYLAAQLSDELLGNFLRHDSSLQKCFQMRWQVHGCDRYVPMERVFAYEHNSPYRLTDNSRARLMDEIDTEEYVPGRLPSRIVLNDLESFIRDNKIDLDKPDDIINLRKEFSSDCLNAEIAIESLIKFCRVEPQLPDLAAKTFTSEHAPLGIDNEMSREEVIDQLASIRDSNPIADMAFYSYRDLRNTEAEPFILASLQRNPVSIAESKDMNLESLVKVITEMPNESIYDGPGRLAQPDEAWNYKRGDGLEKAFLLANILGSRKPDAKMSIELSGTKAMLRTDEGNYEFESSKELEATWEI